MNKIEIDENKLIIGEKEVSFDKNIQEVKILNQIILILLEIDGSLNNVYAINYNCDILWKIKEPKTEFIGNRKFPYVGFSEKDNKVSVIDFYGRRFYLDITNGEIIGADIVK
ncbi:MULTISPECIES: hypothetical protein [unclassified Bacillus (in: firmicutes)]|uniref:hypothetical protein n=1 Tax=Bacillus TaxID=1386 RepID=UPI0033906401